MGLQLWKMASTMPIGLTIESIASRRPAFFLSVVDSPIGFIPNEWFISIRRSFPHFETHKNWSSLIHHPKDPKNPPLFSSRSLLKLRSKTPCALEVCSLFNWRLTRFQWIGGKSYGWHLHKKHRKNIPKNPGLASWFSMVFPWTEPKNHDFSMIFLPLRFIKTHGLRWFV